MNILNNQSKKSRLNKLKIWIKSIIPMNQYRQWKARGNYNRLKKYNSAEIQDCRFNDFPFGINLIGPISSPTGLGEGTRLVAEAIKDAKIPCNVIDYKKNDDLSIDDLTYSINLFQINMHEVIYLLDKVGLHPFHRHYNIAHWSWESEVFPKEWRILVDFYNEIWTPSDFTSCSIRKITNKPVITLPYIMKEGTLPELDRGYFSLLKDEFLFLVLFDGGSLSERKNPKAAIEAYKRAFSRSECREKKIALVIKVKDLTNKELVELKQKMQGYKVYFFTQTMSGIEVNNLIALVDVYVSLHRSEGFGLVLAEAMKKNTPTIATAYSSNVEFQSEENACLVGYTLTKVGNGVWPFEKDSVWADANMDDAAKYMRKLYADREYYKNIQKKAYEDITDSERNASILRILKDRMEVVRREYSI